MSANRWPQEYIDPAKIRAEGYVGALLVGALVVLWTRETLYLIHASELLPVAEAHQTTADAWLRNTVAPRAAPIAGREISIGYRPTPA